MTDSTRGTTPTAVTDNRCLLGTHLLSVTERAEIEANERNQRHAAFMAEHPQFAELAHLARVVTARDVIVEWAQKDASTCTRCLSPIHPKDPVVITRTQTRKHHIAHVGCEEYWWLNRTTTCLACYRVMYTHGVGPRRYCCDNCLTGAAAERERRAKRRAPITCTHCGTSFTGRADARYCSTRCRVAAHRAKPSPPLADLSATSATPQHPTQETTP